MKKLIAIICVALMATTIYAGSSGFSSGRSGFSSGRSFSSSYSSRSYSSGRSGYSSGSSSYSSRSYNTPYRSSYAANTNHTTVINNHSHVGGYGGGGGGFWSGFLGGYIGGSMANHPMYAQPMYTQPVVGQPYAAQPMMAADGTIVNQPQAMVSPPMVVDNAGAECFFLIVILFAALFMITLFVRWLIKDDCHW